MLSPSLCARRMATYLLLHSFWQAGLVIKDLLSPPLHTSLAVIITPPFAHRPGDNIFVITFPLANRLCDYRFVITPLAHKLGDNRCVITPLLHTDLVITSMLSPSFILIGLVTKMLSLQFLQTHWVITNLLSPPLWHTSQGCYHFPFLASRPEGKIYACLYPHACSQERKGNNILSMTKSS